MIIENVVFGLVGGFIGIVLVLVGVCFLCMVFVGGFLVLILLMVDVWVFGFLFGIFMIVGFVFGFVLSFYVMCGKM